MPDPIWKFYSDAACTQPLANPLDLLHYTDGSEGAQDTVFYWAESTSDAGNNQIHQAQVHADPGVANFTLTPVAAADAEHPVTEIKLASTLAGLDTATAGAALSFSPTLLSGANGKKTIYMRVTNSYLQRSTRTDLSIAYPQLLITDV